MVRHFRVPGALRTKLEELGVNVSAVLRTAGLPKDLFDQIRILDSTEQQFALWRAIGDVSKDPSIGLKLGNERELYGPQRSGRRRIEAGGGSTSKMPKQ